MALISCPNCGGQISDKAVKCIHCGYILDTENVSEDTVPNEKHCKECGTVITEAMDVCPNCGCPIEKAKIEETQHLEGVNDKKAEKKIYKIVLIAVIVVGAIIAGIAGYNVYSKEKAKKEYIEYVNTYKENYRQCVYLLIDGASDAEDAGGMIHDVWYNTIYKERDTKTDKYTKSGFSTFNDDFNTSLSALWADPDFMSDIDEIKENQIEVEKLMKELKNPPEEYEDAYEALREFYDAYNKLVNLAVNPTGSLASYTSDFNDADTDTANAYRAASIYVEEG